MVWQDKQAMGMEGMGRPSHGFPGRGWLLEQVPVFTGGYVFLPFKCPGKGRCIIIAHLKGNFNDFITGIRQQGLGLFNPHNLDVLAGQDAGFALEPIRIVEPVIVLYFRQLGHGEVF